MANYPNYMQGAYQPQQQNYYQPMYQPQYAPVQQMAPTISGRMVTSLEEARGVQVDFASGMTVCPDLGHDVIYVKLFDRNTGTAPIVEYRRVDAQNGADPIAKMQSQLDAIMRMLEGTPKGKHAAKEATADD